MLLIYETEVQRWNISVSQLVVGQSGSFALRYLFNGCFLSSAAQLLQVTQILYVGVLQTFGKRAKPWRFDFGYHYAFSLSIFFLMLAFGVVVPMVMPLAYVFFAAKYWTDKYNFMYGIWRVEHETGGVVATIAACYMVGAVAFLQFVMSGYFIVSGLNAADATAAITSIGRGRWLVLSGTLLFLVSLVSGVLLCGKAVRMVTPPPTSTKRKPWIPLLGDDADAILTPDEEDQLLSCYVHPHEGALIEPAATSWLHAPTV